MDHEMPVMNGSNATRELGMLGYKGTIVGVSGNVSLKQTGPFLASGLGIVLIKPVNRSELVEIFSIFECEKEQLEMARSFEAMDGGGGGKGGGGGNGNGKGRTNGNEVPPPRLGEEQAGLAQPTGREASHRRARARDPHPFGSGS